MEEKEIDRILNGITKTEKQISDSRSILYTTVAAILVLIFNGGIEEPLCFLIPFIVIIPMFYVSLVNVKNMQRLAAYQIVFIETKYEELNWETRIYNLYRNGERLGGRFLNNYSAPFLITALICFLLYCHSLLSILKSLDCINLYLRIFYGSVMIVLMFILTKKQRKIVDLKKEYIRQWEIVKNQELKAQ